MYMEKRVIKNCIKKWDEKGNIKLKKEYIIKLKDDENIKEFKKKYKAWLKDNEEKEICITLLKNFEYFGRQRANYYLVKLHEKLLNDYEISNEDTAYSFIKNVDGRANSSMEYFMEYTKINGISKTNRIEDINRMKKKLNAKQVVLIDDCIGTGKTVKKYINLYKEDLKDKKIYILVIYVIKEIADKLKKELLDLGYNVEIICLNQKAKAFSKEIFKDKNEDEIRNIKNKFLELSKKHNIPKGYELGFGEVEGLVSFYNNTPNNTLGIFWAENESNIALFPRNKESNGISLKEIQERKKKRLFENYKNRGRKIG